ncbi:hypothetical protein ENBRE01_1593 [Enteropsectra breve]|nr:hypothetical protein ENBRE01_1593 [Enteropsectra breve]
MLDLVDVLYYDYILYKICIKYANDAHQNELHPFLEILSQMHQAMQESGLELDSEVYLKELLVLAFQACKEIGEDNLQKASVGLMEAFVTVSRKRDLGNDSEAKSLKLIIFTFYIAFSHGHAGYNKIIEDEMNVEGLDQLKATFHIDRIKSTLPLVKMLRKIQLNAPALLRCAEIIAKE